MEGLVTVKVYVFGVKGLVELSEDCAYDLVFTLHKNRNGVLCDCP